MVGSIKCSLFQVGLLSRKPLYQMHRSTFLPLQPNATLVFSVDWGSYHRQAITSTGILAIAMLMDAGNQPSDLPEKSP